MMPQPGRVAMTCVDTAQWATASHHRAAVSHFVGVQVHVETSLVDHSLEKTNDLLTHKSHTRAVYDHSNLYRQHVLTYVVAGFEQARLRALVDWPRFE
jgi:hypothetical protein